MKFLRNRSTAQSRQSWNPKFKTQETRLGGDISLSQTIIKIAGDILVKLARERSGQMAGPRYDAAYREICDERRDLVYAYNYGKILSVKTYAELPKHEQQMARALS